MEPGGQMDMQRILEAAQQMQAQLVSAQQALADSEVTGTAGGGLVTARVSGQGELLDLTIAPQVIDPGDQAETAQTVADLVLAAIRAATQAAEDLQAERMGPFAAALGGAMPGGGLDIGSLGLPGTGPGGLPGMGGPAQVPGSVEDQDEGQDDDEDDDEDEPDGRQAGDR